MNPTTPPYCIVTPDNQADGFSVELLRAALKAIGREVVFKTGPWAALKQELADGRLQALPLVGRTPEREAVYDFTVPYLTMHGAIVVRDDNADVRAPQDLKGRQVAVLQGDNAEEYLRRAGLGAVIVPLPAFETALRELSGGKHDAVVIQKLLALQLMQSAGLHNLRTAGPPLKGFTQNFCFAVRKGDRDLLSDLNEGLSLIMADGTFRMLHAKWFSALEALGRAKSRIVVGGDNDYPPYEFLNRNGQPAGFNVDLTRAIARQMGLAVDIRLGIWSDIRNGLRTGDIDLAQGMFYSVERDQTFTFSPPHAVVQHAIAVREGTRVPAGMDDLAGQTILVMAGDVMADLAVKQGYEKQLVTVPSQEEALRRLASGEHDCALVAKVPALYWIAQKGWRNLRVSDQPVLAPEYCYAAPHVNDELLARFSEGLAAIKATGEYRQIQAKWLSPYEKAGASLRTVVRYVLGASLPLLALLAGSLLWSRSLQTQVTRRTQALRQEIDFRHRAEAALRQSEERFQHVAENAGEWIWEVDADGVFRYCSSAVETLLGYAPAELVGQRHFYDLFVPERRANLRDGALAAIAQRKSFRHFENPNLHKNGKTVIMETSGSPIVDAEGRLLGYRGTDMDITERKQAEAQMQVQIAAMDAVDEAILITERDGIVTWINPACAALTGYAPAEIVGQPASILAPGRQPDAIYRDIQNMLSAGRVWRGELLSRRKDGSLYTEELTITPVSNGEGVLTHQIAIKKDVSERNRLEAKRRQQQKLASIGTLARGMAHEINNPIMGAMNYAQLIKDKAADNATLAAFADEIILEGRRVATMTHSLLGYTEQTERQAPVSASLSEVVASVLPSALEEALAHGIALNGDLPADLPAVTCRQVRMCHLVTALLKNALEAWDEAAPNPASGGGGDKAIRLSARPFDKAGQAWVRLTVADNGPGIREELRERVFDPFFTTKDRTQHAGMGLWIGRSVAQEHGGELSVDCEEGQWTRFHVDLPVS